MEPKTFTTTDPNLIFVNPNTGANLKFADDATYTSALNKGNSDFNMIKDPIINEKFLPKDRATLNSWLRSIYATNKDFSHSIDYSVNKIIDSICFHENEYPNNKKAFKNVISLLKDKNIIYYMIKEYLLIGEVFVYAELDKMRCEWEDFKIQNPDYIKVKRSVSGDTTVSLRPDENLRRIVFSNKPSDIKMRNQLDGEVVRCVREDKDIPLNNFNLTFFIHKNFPYDLRGTSKYLPYLSHICGIEVKNDIEKYYNPEKLYETSKNMLFHRHKIEANKIIYWLNSKIFAPIAKLNDYYQYDSKDRSKELLIPKISQ